MATTTRKIVIVMEDDEGKERNVTISGARSGLTSSDIKPVVNTLIANTGALKHTFVAAKKANIIAQTVTPVSLD